MDWMTEEEVKNSERLRAEAKREASAKSRIMKNVATKLGFEFVDLRISKKSL